MTASAAAGHRRARWRQRVRARARVLRDRDRVAVDVDGAAARGGVRVGVHRCGKGGLALAGSATQPDPAGFTLGGPGAVARRADADGDGTAAGCDVGWLCAQRYLAARVVRRRCLRHARRPACDGEGRHDGEEHDYQRTRISLTSAHAPRWCMLLARVASVQPFVGATVPAQAGRRTGRIEMLPPVCEISLCVRWRPSDPPMQSPLAERQPAVVPSRAACPIAAAGPV